jgi:hypothetical protein
MRRRLPLSRRQGLCLAILLVSGCGSATEPRQLEARLSGDSVTLLDHGWHTDIGIPAAELSGPLAVFRDTFPNAKFVVFSYGKRTFLMAQANSWSEYLLGPIPGPAAIMVTGLTVPAERAYGRDPALVLRLPKGGAERLSSFVWQEFSHDEAGRPRLLNRGPFPGSLFYAAAVGYSLDRTCNEWSALALAAAGLDIDPSGVVLAGQLMTRARRLPPDQAATASPH